MPPYPLQPQPPGACQLNVTFFRTGSNRLAVQQVIIIIVIIVVNIVIIIVNIVIIVPIIIDMEQRVSAQIHQLDQCASFQGGEYLINGPGGR